MCGYEMEESERKGITACTSVREWAYEMEESERKGITARIGMKWKK